MPARYSTRLGVQALASIPSREELLSKLLLRHAQAPVSGFAGLLGRALRRNVKKKTAA